MYKLYSNHNSGHSYKVALMLELNAAPFEICEVNLSTPKAEREASFLEYSTYGEVPVLVCGEGAICQSNHILLYLAEKLCAMGGQTILEQRKVREWLFWEANRIGFSVPNLRYYSKFFDEFPKENRDFLMRRVVADMTVLSEALQDRPFLIGNTLKRFDFMLKRLFRSFANAQTGKALSGVSSKSRNALTIADLSCCGYLYWLDEADIDVSASPHIEAWLGRIAAHPRWCPPYKLLTRKAGAILE